jgi:hypothetical protein
MPTDKVFSPYFSADGRWLVSATFDEESSDQGYHFWRVGTWERERERFIPAKQCWTRAAFTAAGGLMALAVTQQQILLADPAGGRELARLSTPQSIAALPTAFSPDGTQLATTTGRSTVVVWDLRRVREQLAAMGLDWDAPAYPSLTGTESPHPLQVQIIGEVPKPPDADR